MHEGRVVHFEDDSTWQNIVRSQLELDGTSHRLVGLATTLADALELLEQIQNGGIDANVAVLDGNLSDSESCDDARAIRRRISELKLSLRVIGLSSADLSTMDVEVDVTLLKDSHEYGSLIRVLDELPEPEITN